MCCNAIKDIRTTAMQSERLLRLDKVDTDLYAAQRWLACCLLATPSTDVGDSQPGIPTQQTYNHS